MKKSFIVAILGVIIISQFIPQQASPQDSDEIRDNINPLISYTMIRSDPPVSSKSNGAGWCTYGIIKASSNNRNIPLQFSTNRSSQSCTLLYTGSDSGSEVKCKKVPYLNIFGLLPHDIITHRNTTCSTDYRSETHTCVYKVGMYNPRVHIYLDHADFVASMDLPDECTCDPKQDTQYECAWPNNK